MKKGRTIISITPAYKFGKRIRIPQNPYRPLQIKGKDVVNQQGMQKADWWMVTHKRFRRLNVGEDPLEARAVPHTQVTGTLPERIMYKALRDVMHLQPQIDFQFQSSQSGGRMDLGGIVADFLLPYLMMIIQVQGSTHSEYLRIWKDEEQHDTLESMGYDVYYADEALIYDTYMLEAWLRNVFGVGRSNRQVNTNQLNATHYDSITKMLQDMTQL